MPLALALACLFAANSQRSSVKDQLIIFSAQRYGENLGKVYTIGLPKLFCVRKDGTGLKQITTGEGADIEPSMSQDGKRVLFWRGKSGSDEWDFKGPGELCSVLPDGSRLIQLNQWCLSDPNPDRARAVETLIPGLPGSSATTKLTLSGRRRGLAALDFDAPKFNPSCTHVLNSISEVDKTGQPQIKHVVIDLQTGRSEALDGKYYAPRWLNDDMIVATIRDKSVVALLDVSGHELKRKKMVYADSNGDTADTIFEGWPPYDRKVGLFPLWSQNVFLIEGHHPMSDGGYDFANRLNMENGGYKFVDCGTVEAVSPDGLSFVGASYRWYGAYKGAGAAKLCKLSVWDAKKLTHTQIGLRLMTCCGACFAQLH